MKLIVKPLQLNDAGLKPKEYPFEVVILSGKPMHTPELGNFVIDLQTLSFHKQRMAVNYNHDQNKILGYFENFRITDEGLVANGTIGESSETEWFIEQALNEVPFEVSAEIDEKQGIAIELGAGEKAEVNGNTIESETTIYKNVPFLGAAICLHGVDKFTRFTLLKQETTNMSKTNPTTLKTNTTNLSDDKPPEEKKVTSQELKEFIEAFGTERGIELFQSGTNIEDVRKWKELKEKFDLPTPEPPVPAADPAAAPAEPTPEPKPKDETQLSAVLTSLTKTVTELSSEVTRLKAAVPRGEQQPVSHGVEKTGKEPPEKKMSSIDKLAASYKK
jgi:hypothetical protein